MRLILNLALEVPGSGKVQFVERICLLQRYMGTNNLCVIITASPWRKLPPSTVFIGRQCSAGVTPRTPRHFSTSGKSAGSATWMLACMRFSTSYAPLPFQPLHLRITAHSVQRSAPLLQPHPPTKNGQNFLSSDTKRGWHCYFGRVPRQTPMHYRIISTLQDSEKPRAAARDLVAAVRRIHFGARSR